MKNFNIRMNVITVLSLLCLQSAHAFDGSGTIISGGIMRSFVFHCPGLSVPTNLPVVLVYHGDGGTGSAIKGYSGFDAVADANNFIAVYPDAVNGEWNRYVDNAPGDAGCVVNLLAPDDVLFTSDLIDYFCSAYSINPDRVYASGHSAGGFMCYNLAVQLPNKIAAFAPVSASLCGDSAFTANYFSNSYTAVPVYHIHGDADGTVGYPDPDHMPGSWSEWPLSAFSYPNCGNDTYTSTTVVVPAVNRLSFCNSAMEVYLVQIAGGGHGWPNIPGFNAAGEIWNFCNTYSLSTGVNCASGVNEIGSLHDFSILLNPAEYSFSVLSDYEPIDVSLLNIAGAEVSLTKRDAKTFSYSGASTGIYFVKVSSPKGKTGFRKFVIE